MSAGKMPVAVLKRKEAILGALAYYEIRYENEKGQYTEERFSRKRTAMVRVNNLQRKGVEAELWVVNY